MAKIAIHRTRIGKDIVAEFAVPLHAKAKAAGKVVILCQGAPTMPGKSGLIEFLVRKGFYVVLPRYRGSWESSGVFLKQEPTEDIREVINALPGSLVSLYEGKSYAFPKHPKIYIMASSFGGPAAFLLSQDKRVAKVVALSPLCDWRVRSAAEPLDTMDLFSRSAWGEGYRLARDGWKKLAKGNFYNPMTTLSKIDGSKCLIFHSRNDDVVPFPSVFDFAYVTGATLKATRTRGHMGLSEAMVPETWREIARFIRTR